MEVLMCFVWLPMNSRVGFNGWSFVRALDVHRLPEPVVTCDSSGFLVNFGELWTLMQWIFDDLPMIFIYQWIHQSSIDKSYGFWTDGFWSADSAMDSLMDYCPKIFHRFSIVFTDPMDFSRFLMVNQMVSKYDTILWLWVYCWKKINHGDGQSSIYNLICTSKPPFIADLPACHVWLPGNFSCKLQKDLWPFCSDVKKKPWKSWHHGIRPVDRIQYTRPGKRLQKLWKDPPSLMGKSTISMTIFNSFLYVYQAGYPKKMPKPDFLHDFSWIFPS